ncbi:MAG: hypothetical protein U9N85_08275 [Bacteroidota bacterium]|nr:hypothetical protein [Bacteroidota bacterium]
MLILSILKRLGIYLLFVAVLVFCRLGSVVQAQKLKRIEQLKHSEIYRNDNGNNLIITPNEQPDKQYICIEYKPAPHLQKKNKGIRRIVLKCIADELKDKLSDSIVANTTIVADKQRITIFFDSIVSDKFFTILNHVTEEPEWKNLDIHKNSFITNEFAPQLPPYEVIKRKNKRIFYTAGHPLGEPYIKENIGNLSPKQCTYYYNLHLKYSKKNFLSRLNSKDSLIKSGLLKFHNLALPSLENPKFPAPVLPEHNIIHFFESPAKLISDDTYLNIIYSSGFEPDKKNYSVYKLTGYIIGAYEIGLLSKALIKNTGIARHSFSSFETNFGMLEHNLGLILLPKNLAKAPEHISFLIDSIQNKSLSRTEINQLKNKYIEHFKAKLINNGNLIPLQSDILNYNLPADYFSSYFTLVRKTDIDDIQQFANKYLQTERYTMSVFGKKQKIKEQLVYTAQRAEIISYDKNESVYLNLPYGFNARSIIEAFIEKTGAEEKPDAHYISSVTTYSIQKQIVTAKTEIFRRKNKYLRKNYNITDSLKADAYQKILFDKQHPEKFSGTESVKLSSKDSAKICEMRFRFPELKFLKEDYSLKILGTDTVENQECYTVEIRHKHYPYRKSYYKTSDSLKLKTEIFKDSTIQESVLFKSYIPIGKQKEKLLPSVQILKAEQYNAKSVVDSVNFNLRIPKVFFKTKGIK